MFTYLGEYNFNLDNKIIYGTDLEFFKAKYPTDPGDNKTHDEEIHSQYIDYQFRPYENIYATLVEEMIDILFLEMNNHTELLELMI